MKTRIFGWMLIPAAVLVAGAVYVWTARESAPKQAKDVSTDIDQLKNELRRLRAESATNSMLAAQLARHQRSGQGELGEEPTPNTAEGAEKPSSASSPGPKHEVTEAEYAAHLDGTFDAEAVDPKWSYGAAREVSRAITATMPKGTTLGKVECRTNLCRIESFHQNVDAFRDFAESSVIGRERQIWNGGVSTMVRAETGSGVTAITYLAKEGQGIPAMDEE